MAEWILAAAQAGDRAGGQALAVRSGRNPPPGAEPPVDDGMVRASCAKIRPGTPPWGSGKPRLPKTRRLRIPSTPLEITGHPFVGGKAESPRFEYPN